MRKIKKMCLMLGAGVLALGTGIGVVGTLNFDNKAPVNAVAATTNTPCDAFLETFTAIKGTLGQATFEAKKGNAGTAPAVNGGQIRIYQNGGELHLTAKTGYVINDVYFSSGMGTTLDYKVDGKAHSSGVKVNANVEMSLTGLKAKTIVITCKGTSKTSRFYLNYLGLNCSKAVSVVPTKLDVKWGEGKGSYYNGTSKGNSVLKTEDLAVNAINDANAIAESYTAGKGFIISYNGQTLDALTIKKEVSLAGKTAGTYTLTVTVPGAGANKADITGTVDLNILDKEVASYAWKTGKEPKTTFYSHVEAFDFTGVIGADFNDGSTGTSQYKQVNVIREGTAKEGPSIEKIPTHKDGTINCSSKTTYTVESYLEEFKLNPAAHLFTTISVEIPTLTIKNADEASTIYYVGVEYPVNAEVTLNYGADSRILAENEFTLSSQSIKPLNTDPINVNAQMVIDGVNVLTTSNQITYQPEVSTRTLDSLLAEDLILEAGSNFVLPEQTILLGFTEANVADSVYLKQSDCTFAINGKEINEENIVYLNDDSSTVTVTYKEGADKKVSTTFTLLVTEKTISEYVAPKLTDYEIVTTELSDYSGQYLIASTYTKDTQEITKLFDGSLEFPEDPAQSSPTITNGKITASESLNLMSFTVEKDSNDNYFMKSASGKYINDKSGNGIVYNNAPVTFTFANFGNESNPIVKIKGENGNVLSYNSLSSQFRFYKSETQKPVQLYKRASTAKIGDEVQYIKDVIDAYRLNSNVALEGYGLSICNKETGIYATNYWKGSENVDSIKDVYQGLSEIRKAELNIQDKFGETGKTYIDTMEMLIKNAPSVNPSLDTNSYDSTMIITVICVAVLSIFAITFFAIGKRKKIIDNH